MLVIGDSFWKIRKTTVSSVDLHNTARLHWSFFFQYTVTGATSNKWSSVTIRIGKFSIQALIDQAYTGTFFFSQ